MLKISISRTFISGVVALAAVTFALGGCAPFATYPPVEGSVGINNPMLEPVPNIMADALMYVHGSHGGGRSDFAFNLPEGAPPELYDKVIRFAGAGRPMTDASEWGYHVMQVRSRGMNGEADIIFPRENGPAGMTTVYLRKRLSNYRPHSAKVWNFPAEVPPPFYAQSPSAPTHVAGETADH